MVRAVSRAFVLIFLVPLFASAQGGERRAQHSDPTRVDTPRKCYKRAVQDVWAREFHARTDSGRKEYTKEISKAIDSIQRVGFRHCASLFSVSAVASGELKTLTRLYVGADRFDLAKVAMKRRLAIAKTPQERADELHNAVSQFYIYDRQGPPLDSLRRSYLDQLNALGDVALAQRVDANWDVLGSDSTPGARERAATLVLSLAARLPDSARKGRVSSILSNIYRERAESAFATGDVATGRTSLDSAVAFSSGPVSEGGMMLKGLTILGEKAPSFETSHWFNAPASFGRYEPGKGRVTLVEVTAWW